MAKHHTQEFGLLKQLPSPCQLRLARLFSEETLSHLNVKSCLISAILAVLLIATAPEEFGIPECTTTIEAAGLDGPHRWGIILPNSSRVSLLTYKAIVAVRYPELVLHDQDPIQIGHFVPHDHTVGQGGFRTVLWEVPRDSRDLLAAIEDIVVNTLYKDKGSLESANRLKQQNRKPQPNKKRRPANPPARLAFRQRKQRSKQQKTQQNPKNGARAQTKTPTESVYHWTQWHIHCITIKNMQNELWITAVQADMKTIARELTLA